MSEREASVKLTLDNSQYIVNIRRAGDETENAVKKSHKAASAFGAGLEGAKKGMEKLGEKAKDVLRIVGGLAAAFSVEEAVKKAVGLRERFKDIEFQMNKTGRAAQGMTVDWENLQGAARDAGKETGQSTESMADAMQQLFGDVGDIDYAVGSLKAVGAAASASGKSVEQMADVAGMLNEKFGATTDTLPDMLAAIVSGTDSGGLHIDSLKEKFGLLAGEAVDAGFKGAGGLGNVIGMLNMLDDRLGEKSIPSFKKLFQTIKDGSASLKSLEKDAGMTFKPGTTGNDKLRSFMSTEKGRKALAEHVGGDQRVVVDYLAAPFQKAFNDAKKAGDSTEKATKKGLDAYDSALKKASGSTLTYADIEARAAEKAESPQARLTRAMEDFEEAIATPELYSAIDSLAKDLPKLAKALAQVVGLAVHSPWMAGAAGVAAVGGGGFAKAAAGQLMLNIGKSFSGQLKTATAPAAKYLGDTAASTLANNPALGMAGKAFAVAGALAFGMEIGKYISDKIIQGKEDDQNAALGATLASANGVPMADKKAALAKAKESLSGLEDGPGVGESLLGGLTFLGNKAGLVSDSDTKTAMGSHEADLENARKRVRELEANIKSIEEQGKKKEETTKPSAAQAVQDLKTKKVKIDDYEPLAQAIGRHVGLNIPKPPPPSGSRGPADLPPA